MKFILFAMMMWGVCAWTAEPYLRVTDGADGSRILEIAVRTLRAEDGSPRRIHLVAVSHIGSQGYYDALQAKLEEMDLVLFEGVGGDRDEFLRRDPAEDADELQPALARAVGLRFQLHAMDYLRPHFVNSDLTPGELLALFSGENPEDFTAEGLARLEQTLASMQGDGLNAGMMRMFLGMIERHPPFALGVRWALVEILGTVRGDLASVQGLPRDVEDMLRVLLRERNAVVMRDIARVLAPADAPADLAVFYGAAHMHELESRLETELGFRPEKTVWLPAFQGNLERSGLGRMQQNMLRHMVLQQVRMLEGLMGMDKDEGPSVRVPFY
ncbi:MAG: hypothetical protein JJU05_09745 [Verrucomicrobia bacterium]|nr:hypothetical protein [Verrucomicrobiota bacterium]MCH8527569.1 hypothetical protein [Kiritimatiellia bacterium]